MSMSINWKMEAIILDLVPAAVTESILWKGEMNGLVVPMSINIIC